MRHGRCEAGKILVPILGAVAVLAIGAAAISLAFQVQERQRRMAKERELELATAENVDLKGQLEELRQRRARLEEDLARLRQELTNAQAEMAKAVEAQEVLARSVEDREEEIARLTKDVEQARTDAEQAAAQLSVLQTERDTMQQQLVDLDRAKGELEAKVMELAGRPTVELEKVLVGGSRMDGALVQPAGLSPGTSSTGQVVVVNREYDFIVMNLGRNQGLSVGQEFQIVRGAAILGRVRVEKVYDELSAAAILPESQTQSIQEGDLIRAL